LTKQAHSARKDWKMNEGVGQKNQLCYSHQMFKDAARRRKDQRRESIAKKRLKRGMKGIQGYAKLTCEKDRGGGGERYNKKKTNGSGVQEGGIWVAFEREKGGGGGGERGASWRKVV